VQFCHCNSGRQFSIVWMQNTEVSSSFSNEVIQFSSLNHVLGIGHDFLSDKFEVNVILC
jgi:hypothetical protein